MKIVYDQNKLMTQNLPILGRILNDITRRLVAAQSIYSNMTRSSKTAYYNNYSSIKSTNPNLLFVELVFSI